MAVAREVAAALAYAHARNIVHRDIKPENVVFARRAGVGLRFRARVASTGRAPRLRPGPRTRPEPVDRVTRSGHLFTSLSVPAAGRPARRVPCAPRLPGE
ncbi:MAG: protein kinase domain-containing protein [Gemmatimonadales bacterium]